VFKLQSLRLRVAVVCFRIMANRKPPYSSARAIDSFFDKMKTIGDPGTVNARWAKTYGFEPSLAASIPTTLRWLGVINEAGTTTGIWNSLRPPTTRAEVLDPLVRKAYHEIFDAIEVETANRELLEATFIHAYETGDLGRPLTCFLSLCRHANITTAAEPSRATKSGDKPSRARVPSPPASPRSKGQSTHGEPRRSGARNRGHVDLAVTVAVEIPAEWTEAQIEQRIAAVKRIVGQSE
jgi:hypothetical protein